MVFSSKASVFSLKGQEILQKASAPTSWAGAVFSFFRFESLLAYCTRSFFRSSLGQLMLRSSGLSSVKRKLCK